MMSSAGALVDADRFVGKDSVFSGPAGGVVGYAHVAQRAGFKRAIGFDMGGTSTDVSRFDGEYERRYEMEVNDPESGTGVRIVAPMLAIETVAAGGGSICWFDGQKPVVGPRAKVRMRYANGTELRLHLDGDWGPGLGAIFIGEKGKIEINRNKIASNPKELVDSPDNPGPITKMETQYHIENWVDCVKTRAKCHADIEYGQRSTTLCYLVNIARELGRVGEVLKWDPKTERFTNCPEANQSSYMVRPRRKGYELPPLT